MTVSAEIKAAQEAYAARPFAVYWRHSHAAGCHRFETLADAFSYIDTQWATIRRRVAAERYTASDLRSSYLETPKGRVSLRYVLLAADVSSY